MRAEAAVTRPVTQYLTFTVAGEEYAIAALRVREILAYSPLTRVPRAPGFICGVMNLRGSVIPVVDLRVKLALPPTPITPLTCIVIVEVEGEQGQTTMAILADEVRDVVDLTDEQIEPTPTFGTRIDFSFLHGMGDAGDHFLLLLNADKVLTTLELIAAQNVAVEAKPGDGPDGSKASVSKKKKRQREDLPA
jgi:purine-binding chemotaxis protein CheW